MRGPRGRRVRALAGTMLALGVLTALPISASAHPLGNFTVNHYDGIRVSADRVAIDHVLDMAEIPTFRERAAIDTDRDGEVSAGEGSAYAATTCDAIRASLQLSVGGAPTPLTLERSAVSFPPGQAGAATLRLACLFGAQLPAPIPSITELSFRNDSYAERLGWREIVVEGDGVAVDGGGVPLTGVSARLTAYPEDQLAEPLRVSSVEFTVSPGGSALPPLVIPELESVAVPAPAEPGPAVGCGATGGSLPGGVGEIGRDVCELVQARDLTPAAIFVSLLVAAGLGAAHALSPGHGKTVMAAFLVGTRGSLRHAVGLGLAVTVSHTLGVLGLGAITLFAAALLPPERLQLILGVASGLIVIAIGLYLVSARLRERRRVRAEMERWHDHEHAHAEGRPHEHLHGAATGHEHGHGGDHEHEHGHSDEHGHGHDDADGAGWHSHGPFRHSHIPERVPEGVSWRALFALGLSGGLVPSASALIVLLVSISLGRPAYGIVLTIAFGMGMAAVLIGIGVALVHARGLIERIPNRERFAAIGRALPLATAVIVLGAGVLITYQAVAPFV